MQMCSKRCLIGSSTRRTKTFTACSSSKTTNSSSRSIFRLGMAMSSPGSSFGRSIGSRYNSGIAITLGEIIYKVSGVRADKFAERYLFAPLGISNYYWWKYPNGTVQTGGGLSLQPRDMAKIGALMLHGGRWQGKQIVSEA